ncbi:MAG: DMT family transporter [Sedimenticola sp.]|nr:DMT family transporter [Sedimenticola sp.]
MPGDATGSENRHIATLVIGCLMMGSMGVFANLIEQTHAANVVFMRFFFCVLSLPLIALIAYPLSPRATRIKLAETLTFIRCFPRVWLMVGASMGLAIALYTLGSVLLSVGLSVILLYTASIWFPLADRIACRYLFRDLKPVHFREAYYLSVLLNLSGLAIIIMGTTRLPDFGSSSSVIGLVCAVSAGIAFAITMVLTRVMKINGIKTDQVIVPSSVIGSLLMLPAVFFLPLSISVSNIGYALGMGFVATALGGLVYFKGFGSVRPALAPILAYFEPIFGFSLAVLVLSEAFTPLLLTGMGLILLTNIGYTLLDISRSRQLLDGLDP